MLSSVSCFIDAIMVSRRSHHLCKLYPEELQCYEIGLSCAFLISLTFRCLEWGTEVGVRLVVRGTIRLLTLTSHHLKHLGLSLLDRLSQACTLHFIPYVKLISQQQWKKTDFDVSCLRLNSLICLFHFLLTL